MGNKSFFDDPLPRKRAFKPKKSEVEDVFIFEPAPDISAYELSAVVSGMLMTIGFRLGRPEFDNLPAPLQRHFMKLPDQVALHTESK